MVSSTFYSRTMYLSSDDGVFAVFDDAFARIEATVEAEIETQARLDRTHLHFRPTHRWFDMWRPEHREAYYGPGEDSDREPVARWVLETRWGFEVRGPTRMLA